MTRCKTDHKASPLCAESIQSRLCEEKKNFDPPPFKPFVVKLTTVLDMSRNFSALCTIRSPHFNFDLKILVNLHVFTYVK